MPVRPATVGDLPTVRSICNAAMLDLDDGVLRSGLVLVAVEDGCVLGALALDGSTIHAVAVRPRRRGQGIATALVEEAARCRPTLTASFDPAVRPLYESLGFDVVCTAGRCVGQLTRV